MNAIRASHAVRWRLALAASLLAASAGALAAPQVVTVCGRADAPGGLNLETAYAAGGIIEIRCPPGQNEIVLTRTLTTPATVGIDGGGKVTLRGPVAGPLFAVGLGLHLTGVTVSNPRTGASAGAPHAGSIAVGIVRGAAIELRGVVTQDSLGAYVARDLMARDSTFARNGDAARPGAFAAIVSADRIDLRNVTFNGNFDAPIGGGSAPIAGQRALARTVSIVDSTFANNRTPLLLTDAVVEIRRTRFQGNGTPPAQWGAAWGCCGGALTLVRCDATLAQATFRDNAAPGFGGAVQALGTRLRIEDTLFEGNRARAGGAVMSWGRAPLLNPWSEEAWTAQPGLSLSRTQFRRNAASLGGGALLFAGRVEGEQVLLRANDGGAIAGWQALALPAPFDGVLAGLAAHTAATPADMLALARPIFVDNTAAVGPAIAAGGATVEIGNGLVARNGPAGATGAIAAARLVLVNTTVADNPAGGVAGHAGAPPTVRLGNSILLRNGPFQCAPGTAPASLGGNLQYPGNDCGGSASARDPGLGDDYRPGLAGAARNSGVTALCTSHALVASVDLFGRARLQRGRCDAGAIEEPLPQSLAAGLGTGTGPGGQGRLLVLLFVLAILLFLLGLWWSMRRRRCRRARG